MEKQKNNKGYIIIIILLIVCVLALVGYIVYTHYLIDKNLEKNQDNSIVEETIATNEELTIEEIQDLVLFINEKDNYAFSGINYTSPEELIKNKNFEVLSGNMQYLAYSIKVRYGSEPTAQELAIIWPDEVHIETQVTTPLSISSYLKEKTNVVFTEEEVKNAFASDYFEEIDKVAFRMSDTIFGKTIHILDGYKKDDKIYLTLDGNKELVLTYEETTNFSGAFNKYYFYSCIYN